MKYYMYLCSSKTHLCIMSNTIAIINDKGGVAKTTTTANLGTALWLLGNKVLLIDTDMQCNLTATLDKTALNVKPNLYTWMTGRKSEDIPVYTRYEGLDFIPSSPEVSRLESFLTGKAGADRYLMARLAVIHEQYDYILIDCAPGCTSQVNLNVLEACDSIIVPMRSDLYSITGRGILMQHINEIREIREDGKPEVLGMLLTQFEPRTEMGRLVRQHYRDSQDMPPFPVSIRKCEDCNKAPARQMSVFEFNAAGNAADDYMSIAERIDGRLPRKKTWTPTVWGKKATEAFKSFITEQEKGE